MCKPITILELAEFRGAKPDEDGNFSLGEIIKAGVPFFGGCVSCAASIACYNAYPSKSGYLKCKDCIGNDGFETVEDANREIFGSE